MFSEFNTKIMTKTNRSYVLPLDDRVRSRSDELLNTLYFRSWDLSLQTFIYRDF